MYTNIQPFLLVWLRWYEFIAITGWHIRPSVYEKGYETTPPCILWLLYYIKGGCLSTVNTFIPVPLDSRMSDRYINNIHCFQNIFQQIYQTSYLTEEWYLRDLFHKTFALPGCFLYILCYPILSSPFLCVGLLLQFVALFQPGNYSNVKSIVNRCRVVIFNDKSTWLDWWAFFLLAICQ